MFQRRLAYSNAVLSRQERVDTDDHVSQQPKHDQATYQKIFA